MYLWAPILCLEKHCGGTGKPKSCLLSWLGFQLSKSLYRSGLQILHRWDGPSLPMSPMDNLDNFMQGKLEVTWNFIWESLGACREQGERGVGARLTAKWWVSSLPFNSSSTEAENVGTTPSFIKSLRHPAAIGPGLYQMPSQGLGPSSQDSQKTDQSHASGRQPQLQIGTPLSIFEQPHATGKQLLWKMTFSFPPAAVRLFGPPSEQVLLV